MEKEECQYCKAITDKVEGPTHEYMTSTSSCWATYGSILEKEYSEPQYMKVHRLTVDAYACQHPGQDEPRANQSVIVHLAALHLAFEKEMEFSKIPKFMQELIIRKKGKFERLNQSDFSNVLNVSDVAKAKDSEEHCSLVRKWANQVWIAWSGEHQRIENLVREVL